jgi:hypothetical protein
MLGSSHCNIVLFMFTTQIINPKYVRLIYPLKFKLTNSSNFWVSLTTRKGLGHCFLPLHQTNSSFTCRLDLHRHDYSSH